MMRAFDYICICIFIFASRPVSTVYTVRSVYTVSTLVVPSFIHSINHSFIKKINKMNILIENIDQYRGDDDRD